VITAVELTPLAPTATDEEVKFRVDVMKELRAKANWLSKDIKRLNEIRVNAGQLSDDDLAGEEDDE
jgi:hypothetical protein